MKNLIKYILVWVFVLVVGSLIVSFLIDPNSFQSFKSNVASIFPEKEKIEISDLKKINTDNELQEDNKIKSVEPEISLESKKAPEPEITEVPTGYWGKCSLVELAARDKGMSYNEMKETLCKMLCGDINLDYYSYECDKDRLRCYCE